MEKYIVARAYFDSDCFPTHVIQEDLTLEEAQDWCNNPDTSSTTCSSTFDHIARERGPWFDYYTKEENFK